MPTLLEIQRSFSRSLMQEPDEDMFRFIVGDALTPGERLGIYRNTSSGVMVGALRLAFVAVQHVLGPEFFEGAARLFADRSPPNSAWLDEYGADFPDFLARLPQAASLPYLGDLARFEWKVNLALHATDAASFDVTCLAGLSESQLSGLRLRAHPAAHLIQCRFPADALWQAVLARDDKAMAAIDLTDGPVSLLVQRTPDGIEVTRLNTNHWRIAAALFSGQSLGTAMAGASGPEAHAALATLLAQGCFTALNFDNELSMRNTQGMQS